MTWKIKVITPKTSYKDGRETNSSQSLVDRMVIIAAAISADIHWIKNWVACESPVHAMTRPILLTNSMSLDPCDIVNLKMKFIADDE